MLAAFFRRLSPHLQVPPQVKGMRFFRGLGSGDLHGVFPNMSVPLMHPPKYYAPYYRKASKP